MRAMPGWALVAVLMIASLSPARAAEPPTPEAIARARDLFEQGRRKFDVKLYAEALERFRAAYQAAPMPAFLYNIALCEDRIGDPAAAIESLNQYFARVDPGTDVSEARAFQAELEARRGQPRPPERKGPPVYKRWWPWTILAGGVVVGVGLGVGLGLGLRDSFSPTLPGGVVDLSR